MTGRTIFIQPEKYEYIKSIIKQTLTIYRFSTELGLGQLTGLSRPINNKILKRMVEEGILECSQTYGSRLKIYSLKN